MRHGTTATAKIPAASMVGRSRSTRKSSSFERPSRLAARSTRSSAKAPVRCSRRPLRRKSTTSWPTMPIDATSTASGWSSAMVIFPPGNFSREPVPWQVKQPRVRDNSPTSKDRVVVLAQRPAAVSASQQVGRGADSLALPQGNFHRRLLRGALRRLLGRDAPNLSPNVIVRLKEKWSQEYEAWSRRDLSQKHYLYVWADGIYVNVRLEDDANRRQCLLVLMGATSEGKKELIAVIDGYRESEQSWTRAAPRSATTRSVGGSR